MARIVIALGGNALGNTPAEQRERIAAAAPSLVGLIAQGHEIIVSHGNGPQVGAINLAFDHGHAAEAAIPTMDLPECTAMSQGYIGYHLQQGIAKELRAQGIPRQSVTVVTQVAVDPHDPAFTEPTKPIGSFHSAAQARALMSGDPSLEMREDSGRGWRRVVASPKPVEIVERDAILHLLDHHFVVIACGGGGVPVAAGDDGALHGVPAVIDKDFASAALADAVGADFLFILTAVDRVAIRFGTPEQSDIEDMDIAAAREYIAAGHFGAGSMLPKVEAAVQFVAGGDDRRAVICSLANATLAMKGESGTAIRP